MYQPIPDELDDRYPLTVREFCEITRIPRSAVMRWWTEGAGPSWVPFNGAGRLYITAAEARRFMASPAFDVLPKDAS